MTTHTRTYVPGHAYHVVQRGNLPETPFLKSKDFQPYLDLLYDAMLKYGAQLHAYSLLENQVHLLLTPSRDDSISRIMSQVHDGYGSYMYHGPGARSRAWLGWYVASVVDSSDCLLTCYRYIEAVPVVAGLVASPEAYYWSSARANFSGLMDVLVTPHADYMGLGFSAGSRRLAYASLFDQSVEPVIDGVLLDAPRGQRLANGNRPPC